MVKIYALSVLYKCPTRVITLKSAHDLSSFGYFQRGSVQEFMTFTSQIVVERTMPATRSSVKEQEYMCHVYVRADSLAGVLLCDLDYPHRVAHTLLGRVLDEFAAKVPASLWTKETEATIPYTELPAYLAKYQNPQQADAMTKIQTDLDETKIILHNTIESLLQRGEKLDDLVDKSNVLTLQSKAFYKTAKKTNACCKML